MVQGMLAPALIPIAVSTLFSSSPLPIKHCWPYRQTTLAFATLERTKTPNCRPAVILPGLGNSSNDYQKLQLTLKHYGVPTVVANVSRIDWLRNAAGLADLNYWRGTLHPRPVLDWYLKRVDEAICEAKLLDQGGGLSLIGHSAGGWLARVYMEAYGIFDISLLLTLGTPHMPPPKGSPGVIDQTRGLLDYVERYCARAVYAPELKYVCIAGRRLTWSGFLRLAQRTCSSPFIRYIEGARFFGNATSLASSDSEQLMTEVEKDQVNLMTNTSKSTSFASGMRARFIGQGYKQVCGQADVWGDGVVPHVSAHLEGALNITLDGVYHSPVGSNDTVRPWYGSPAVVEKWVHHLLS